MAIMTVSLPDPMRQWIEDEVVGTGGFATASDYIGDLVRRDRERRQLQLTPDELRELVAEAKASGVSARSVEEIFAAARRSVAGG